MSFEKVDKRNNLMLGMYVRCPVERRGNYDDDRYLYCHDFYMGQIDEIDADGKVHVIFHDPANIRQILTGCMTDGYWKSYDLKRVKPMMNTSALVDGHEVTILETVEADEEDNGLYRYYVRLNYEQDKRIVRYREDVLVLPFNRADFNPLQQMKSYELQAPRWYLQRKIASAFMNDLENVPFGIKNLIGTRVYLLPHQVDTIMRALAEKPCRLMLADEVGLGKTIEALSILKSMQDLSSDMKTLIVVPDSLLYQWHSEIRIKCWLHVDTIDSCNSKTKTLLLTYEEFETSYKNPRVFLGNWDLLIVDETHRLLNDERMYRSVQIMSRRVRDVLILSATPILHRGNEYHKLLRILNPERFEKMDEEEFKKLLEKQRNLQHMVFPLVRDLDDYLAYDDVPEEYIGTLERINEDLGDDRLAQIISEIDIKSEDNGLHMVKVALAYITEFYQIERGVIRHRRRDTVADGIKRSCENVAFEKGNAEFAVFEEECYENALDLAENEMSSEEGTGISRIKRLMMAASSSPYALKEVMEDDGWEDASLSDYCIRWMESYDNEIVNMSQVSDDIDTFHSKLARVIDYIDQEDYQNNHKVLIFTSFTCNIKKMHMGFENFFGKGSTVMFFREMEADDLQEAADRFQNEKKCKFLICDETGGEGRNFQIADYIVHFDLPWSPAVLEQRIGRLDRIGRDKNRQVKSVVMIPEGTLEDQLFELYRDVFKIFDYSLCGLEIAFEEIQCGIDSALFDDLRYGLMKYKGEFEAIIKRTDEEVEDERYFDQGRYALNEELQMRIGTLIHRFTYDDGKELMEAMLAWTTMAGIRANIEYRYGEQNAPLLTVRTESNSFNMKCMQNALYRPKRMDGIAERAYANHMFQGTFSREMAINHENVTFLAPYHPFFDSILDNAMESYRGRSCAMKYKRAPIDWCGFLLTWNVHFNPSKVFEQGFPEEIITIISRYLPLKQFFTCMPINDASKAISKEAVLEAINAVSSGTKPEHLGKRGDEDNRYKGKLYPIDYFVDKLYPEIWNRWVDRAYGFGYKEVVDEMQLEIPYGRAREDLENLLVANEARYRFYGENGKKAMISSQESVDALLYGLEHPHISLDSMAFYWLKKEE